MRAVVIHAPRDLRVEAVEPVEPAAGEVVVRIGAGGICGSDLHYYQDGGFGTVRIREPMILGHEIAGTVSRVGAGVTRVAPGTLVAVNPSRPCGHCRYCLEGKPNHCLNMRFYGSAMPFPHIQGAFRDELLITEAQAFALPDGTTVGEAAMAEPLSVGLHAIQRAGGVLGKRVLVTGCGPIGSLLIGALRRAGAAEIVAADIASAPLACALKMGADRVIDSARDIAAMDEFKREKGSFDVLFEASGNERAMLGALETVRPRGVVVVVGLGGDIRMPMNAIVGREIELRGTFRFHEEFAHAVHFIGSGLVDVTPVLSATVPVERAVEAFELAADRTRSMKVQLSFAAH
ncbi:MAG: L-idonate 5-dehydrogenase [Lautropia sp.]